MEPAADFDYLAPVPEGEKNPTRRCKQCWKTIQGESHVTFADTTKITQLFAFIHASVFIIKILG